MENDDSKNWKKISKALFTQKSEPASEAFVQSVMGRIRQAQSSPRLVRIPSYWFAPVIGIAAMLLLAILPARVPVSAESIILGGTDAVSGMAITGNVPEADDILSFVMEEQ